MLIEAQRLFVTGLGDGGYGINDQIANLDIFSGDSAPPDIVTISSETQNTIVAHSRVLEPLPSIAVVQAGPVELDPNVLSTIRDGEVILGVRYYAKNSQTQNVRRDALYTLRALQKFLQDFFDDTNAADRIINNVSLEYIAGLRHEEIVSFVKDNIIIGQLTVTISVRDSAP